MKDADHTRIVAEVVTRLSGKAASSQRRLAETLHEVASETLGRIAEGDDESFQHVVMSIRRATDALKPAPFELNEIRRFLTSFRREWDARGATSALEHADANARPFAAEAWLRARDHARNATQGNEAAANEPPCASPAPKSSDFRLGGVGETASSQTLRTILAGLGKTFRASDLVGASGVPVAVAHYFLEDSASKGELLRRFSARRFEGGHEHRSRSVEDWHELVTGAVECADCQKCFFPALREIVVDYSKP
jgi:hypothetical protein